VLKKSLTRAVAARQEEVASPHDLFDLYRKGLYLPRTEGHNHIKRSFVFVESDQTEQQNH